MGFIPENVIVNLKKEIAESGGAAVEALTTRVQSLETTVGDETGGLVKDVDDLETVVGDSTSGLVKTVTDQGTSITGIDNRLSTRTSYYSNESDAGWFLGERLYRKVISVPELPNNTTLGINTGLSDITIRSIRAIANSSTAAVPFPINTIATSFNYSAGILYISTTDDRTSYSANIILEYTKNPAPELREEDPENNDVLK